jgi:O-methyltransferase
MYESTWVAINALYPKLSPGGWLILDDYWSLKGAAEAVNDYRAKNNITVPVEHPDWNEGGWRKPL